jgi:hypothetical protein
MLYHENDSDLSEVQRARIKAELVPGERLLWASVGRVSDNDGCGPVILSVLALGCLIASAVLFTYYFRRTAPPDANEKNIVIGAVFTGLFGFFFIVTAVNAWLNRKGQGVLPGHLFALTHRRAIIWRPSHGKATEVISLLPDQVMNLSRVERADGSGDLRFWAGEVVDTGDSFIWDRPAFTGIKSVRQVEELARRVFFPDFLAPSPEPTV